MLLLNFTHPLTATQLAAIYEISGAQVERVIEIKTQLDPTHSFAEQAHALIEAAGLSSEEWQTKSMLIHLPSFSPVAALILAELHGRMGYFPAIPRLRPVETAVPPQFEVAEIINLQAVRDRARQDR
jgi:hypothetical protein